jgi:hypothetical protein
LKRAFKRKIILSHPDKGGCEEDFEAYVAAYMYLSDVVQRLSGGRADLHSVLYSPDELQAMRNKELVRETNRVLNEIYDDMSQEDSEKQVYIKQFNEEFNKVFEQTHESDNLKGYEGWLKADSVGDLKADSVGDLKEEEKYSDNTDFQLKFEEAARKGKPAVTSSSLMLHPDEMALHAPMGTLLLQESGSTFTSIHGLRPEYTDLYAAYTVENTVIDKLPVTCHINKDKDTATETATVTATETATVTATATVIATATATVIATDTVEQFNKLCKERSIAVFKTEEDRDLAEIAAFEAAEYTVAYEKRKAEKEAEHQRRIADYFNGTLCGKTILDTVKTEEKKSSENNAIEYMVSKDASDPFIKEF